LRAAEPQHLVAFAQANRIKSQMNAVRRELRQNGMGRAADLLEDPDEFVARMRLMGFLTAIKQVRADRAVDLMRRARLSSRMLNRRIGPLPLNAARRNEGELTERQRRELARVLRSRA
jgi:hypothetical protein